MKDTARHPGLLIARLVLGLVGLAVIVGDIVQWRRVLDSGVEAGPGHVPGLLLGVLLIAAALLGRQIASAYKSTALLLLHVIVLVLLVEVGSGMILWNRARVRNARVPTDMYLTPAFRDKPWADAYWREFAASDQQYYFPFTTFRRKPFAGRYINIDNNRMRVTPGANCQAGAYVAYMLGGSTMWGTGAPDSLTIAAFVQRGLAERMTRPVCVVNFGESAYVATQSLIGLSLALRAGARPDAVISYDGVNDVFAAFQSGHAGSHQNESTIAAGYPRPHWALQMLQASATFTLLRGSANGAPADTGASLPVPALADSVTKVYLGVVDEIRKLGVAYGFKTIFFWQPEIGESQKTFTADEQRIATRLNRRLVDLYKESYQRVAAVSADPADDLFDISNALANEKQDIFFDYAHIVPEGNSQVAKAMLAAWDSRMTTIPSQIRK